MDHLAFSVPDVDRFLRDHRADFKVVMRPFDEGGDRLAYVTDPDGVWIELMAGRKARKKRAQHPPR